MEVVFHPLTGSDVARIIQHVFESSGDPKAAARREGEITTLVASIAANPRSGTRLSGSLEGWRVRHGGRQRMVTIVFRPDDETGILLVALVAFGAQDWVGAMEARRGFSG